MDNIYHSNCILHSSFSSKMVSSDSAPFHGGMSALWQKPIRSLTELIPLLKVPDTRSDEKCLQTRSQRRNSTQRRSYRRSQVAGEWGWTAVPRRRISKRMMGGSWTQRFACFFFCMFCVHLLIKLWHFPREESVSPSDFAGQGRRSRALNKSDDAEFSTGLLIGKKDLYNTVLSWTIANKLPCDLHSDSE